MINQDEVDQNIELYFFDPNKEKDDFIKFYKKIKSERYQRDGGYRYSPLFIIQKDIRFCTGARKQFCYIPKNKLDPANFAGIILIYTAFYNLVKKFFGSNFPGFAKKFMNLNQEEYKIIRYLRDALIHNNYSLFWRVGNLKYYFLLGFGLPKLIEKIDIKTSYNSSFYSIDVGKLRGVFENAAVNFKEYLLDRGNKKSRNLFIKNFNVDNWVFMKDSNAK